MKNKKCFILFCSLLMLLAGCNTVQQELPKNAPVLTSLDKKIRQADAFMKQKNYQKAFILYSEAQKETQNIKIYRNLQLKISSVQYEMKNYPAALAALSPMPELPATLNDCQKLVMASRILQKMKGKGEYIEALLEVALDNSINEPGVIPFKAAGFAELGKVYVANKKTSRAVKCFGYAAKLYDMVNDKENAVICRNIMEYLK